MPLSAVAPTPKPPAAPAAVTAQCNDCTLLSLHNAITTHQGSTTPPLRSPYPGVNQKMHPLLIPQLTARTLLHRQHDAVNAICYHSTPLSPLLLPPHPAPTAPLTEPRTTSLNEPSSHPFSYPGVNQKTNHLPSLRLPTHSSTQPPPALAPTSLTESSAP